MIDAQTDALDKMDEAFKEEKDEEIKKLEETASSYQKRWNQAIEYIRTHYDTLYQELIDWNYRIGDSLSTDIEAAWKNAEQAVQHYGSVAEAVLASVNAKVSESGVNDVVGVAKSTKGAQSAQLLKSIMTNIQSMKENSKSYNADGPNSIKNGTENQRARAAKNDDIAKTISKQMGVELTRNQVGEWRLPDGRRLYDISAAEVMDIIGYVETEVEKASMSSSAMKKVAGLEKSAKMLSKKIQRLNAFKNTTGGTLALASGPQMLNNLSNTSNASYSNITNNRPVTITIGDTIINGENGNTVSQFQKTNEELVNQIARTLGVRR